MKLKDFLKMWRDDPEIELVLEVDKNEHPDGIIDLLYHVLYKDRTVDYGRHAALRVRISKIREVLEHTLLNIQANDFGNREANGELPQQNWATVAQNWFMGWSSTYISDTSGTAGPGFVYATGTTDGTAFNY